MKRYFEPVVEQNEKDNIFIHAMYIVTEQPRRQIPSRGILLWPISLSCTLNDATQ